MKPLGPVFIQFKNSTTGELFPRLTAGRGWILSRDPRAIPAGGETLIYDVAYDSTAKTGPNGSIGGGIFLLEYVDRAQPIDAGELAIDVDITKPQDPFTLKASAIGKFTAELSYYETEGGINVALVTIA